MNERFSTRGFATFDAVIALAVLGLTIGALAPLAFGDGTLSSDVIRRRNAVRVAERVLDRSRGAALTDFSGVLPYTRTEDDFAVSLRVQQTERYLKKIMASVRWPIGWPSERQRSVELATFVVNNREEETCWSFSSGDWRRPAVATYSLSDLIGDPSGTYPVTGLDTHDGRLYVTTSHGALAQPTVFVFDLSSEPPRLLGAFDNDMAANTGPAALVIVPRDRKIYAYLASGSSFTRGQLQAVDVTEPVAEGWKPSIVTLKIPSSAVPSAGLGNAIAYRDGRVYLGLTAVSGGVEFNVFDAGDPLWPRWLGGYGLGGHAVNAVAVRGNLAYVAHPTAGSDTPPERLTVLDISDPTTPARKSGFDFPGGIGGNGKSVAVLGERVYLGRTASRISGPADVLPELFELSANTSDADPLAAQTAVALDTPESVNDFVVRDRLVFALTSSQLQVWDFGSALWPSTDSVLPAPLPFTPPGSTTDFVRLPGRGVALDCEDDALYAASVSSAGAGFITIITPT